MYFLFKFIVKNPV